MANKPTIAIIGAGVAGLRAAEYLLSKNLQVTIFEARDRIGGRIQQSDGLGKLIDLGPNWVHGTVNNPIVPLSDRAGAILHNFNDVSPIVAQDGTILDQTEADQLQNDAWTIIESATEYSKEYWKDIEAGKSLFDYAKEETQKLYIGSPVLGPSSPPPPSTATGEALKRLEAKRTESAGRVRWKGKEKKKKQLLMDLMHMWGAFVGTDVSRQSLRFFYLEEPIEGENLFVANTYKSTIETLSKPAIDANCIRLNTPITSITTSDSPNSKITLTTCSDSFQFDRIIITAPLGTLKQNLIQISPPLPPRIQKAISSISYGHLEKVYLHFPRAFWPDTPESATFYNFLSPNYAPDTNPDRWHMCCFSLAHLPGDLAQSTLLFYIFGETSAHLTNRKEFPDPTTPEGFKRFADFFRPYYSRLPRYKVEEDEPDKIVVTSWSNDKWAGNGSYSNFQVGLEDGEGDIVALREGMPERGVWFAGEHTSPVLGLGSVSGAYWSGEEAGRRVAASLEGEKEVEVTPDLEKLELRE